MKGSNPLNDIAANLGVTPKVLTQLATGEDREFRELVRGILSMLPGHEVIQVVSDPDINPEFLGYLCRLFDANTEVLLAILRNPSSDRPTKQYTLEHLPEDVLTSFLKNPKTDPEIRQIMTQGLKQAGSNMEAPTQTTEFRIKMKVSKLLNDLEANLGVTIDAFLKIRSRDDEQTREFVNEVYDALPEDNVLLVARDPSTNPQILGYLCRLFDTNAKVLLTILHNPSADNPARQFILEHIPEKLALSLAESPKTPPRILQLLGEHFTHSVDLLAILLANPSTPMEAKENIQALDLPDSESVPDSAELDAALEVPDEMILELSSPEKLLSEQPETETGEVEAKITLCVDKLYDINTDIVTEFIKQARSEIVKRLNLIAKANRIILRAIVRYPNLSIEDLENINMDMFVSLLKTLPNEPGDRTVLKLIQQSKKN
ncbi:MAG: hypothetical protein GY801_08360 [bacterium]|nr:hypothetical protein [bacterium]